MTEIHIALTFDDGYWAPAYATMRSVCLSTKRRKEVVFHLFRRAMTPRHMKVLQRIEAEFGARLVQYDIDRNEHFLFMLQKAPENKRLSNICYARLLFAETIPANVERLIYLDCDVLVRSPIERLADLDLHGKALAAVPDYTGQHIMTGRMMVDKRGIFDSGMRYFNAGMLVIDMKQWRERNVMARFYQMLDSGILAQIYYDQDFLNLTFEDQWLELDQIWNLHDADRSHEALNPHIVHYTGEDKPWRPKNRAAFSYIYRHTMTNDVYYDYLTERSPGWLRPAVRLVKRLNG